MSPLHQFTDIYPDSKVHGASMGPIWGRQDPGGPHVGLMIFAIWVVKQVQAWTTKSHAKGFEFLVHYEIQDMTLVLCLCLPDAHPMSQIMKVSTWVAWSHVTSKVFLNSKQNTINSNKNTSKSPYLHFTIPVSTTNLMPCMVTEVSAMLVERMTFLAPWNLKETKYDRGWI